MPWVWLNHTLGQAYGGYWYLIQNDASQLCGLEDADVAVILGRSRDTVNMLGSLRSPRVLLLGVLCLFLVFQNCFLFTEPKKIECMPQSSLLPPVTLLLVGKDDMAAVLRLRSRRGAGLEGHR